MIRSQVHCINSRDRHRQENWLLGALALIVVGFFGAWAIFVDRDAPVRLVVYGFSTQEEVFAQGIFPAFKKTWEAETGQGLIIEGVFGPSGTLARQIHLGAPADVALFSNAQHVTRLKGERLAHREPQPSVFGYTPLVIVTRPSNPAGITSFADLARPGLHVLHADPRTSGAGEWSILAAYGSVSLTTSSDYGVEAETQLKSIWRNVRLLGPSARATLTLFELGVGDALMTYEQDARLALERFVPLEIVVPTRTIVAQHVAVIVDENVEADERPVAKAFIDFLLSDDGQRILSQYYLRPAHPDSDGFPRLNQLFTVEDLGGWSRAYTELIEVLWQAEIEPRLDFGTTPSLLDTERP